MVEIIRASAKDKTILSKLAAEIHAMHAEAYPLVFKARPDSKDLESYFEQVLSVDTNVVLLAMMDEKAVGYIWAQFQKRPDTVLINARSRLLINHLYVGAECRRRGIGSTLMEEMSTLATSRRVEEIALGTLAFNVDAQRFYQRMGYETYELKMWKQLDRSTD